MIIAPVCAAILALAVAQPTAAQLAAPQARGPKDTGNMAYPDPLPQGNFATVTPAVTGRPADTGNMAYPSPANPGNSVRAPAQAPAKR